MKLFPHLSSASGSWLKPPSNTGHEERRGMATNTYSGAQKAAILLLSFGEEISAEIFKNMNEFEIKRIGSAMSRLGRLEQEVVDEIMLEFYEILQQNKKFFYGGSEF